MDKRSVTSIENGRLGGRPRGSSNRPMIRDYITPDDVVSLMDIAKKKAEEGDSSMMKFLLEQIFGRAVQPIGNDGDEPFKISGVEIYVRK